MSDAQAQAESCSALLHVTADSGSLANLSVPLPAGTSSAYADGWFNITTAGVLGNNVPYFRFFSGSTRIADVYRYNNMHVAPNGAATDIQVWFDGTLLFSSNANNTAATSLSKLQLGAEHMRQMGDNYIDSVVIKAE